ncbi:hypothetical protein DCCM_4476 [Desulfocucumis palustris]|uniref:Uncharacterized protein n=1 Tax=Desulfocucumis palustris TaxID=1898651 RepID=A0A2L2XI41_9FIRM|nr:hypothetical protein DCCM_4476 [Desulfocucumis palustris]
MAGQAVRKSIVTINSAASNKYAFFIFLRSSFTKRIYL